MNLKGLLKGLLITQDSRFMRIFLTKCPKKLDLACVVIKIGESLQFQFNFGGIQLRLDMSKGHSRVFSTQI